MPSPFPGMDPFIESQLWDDFHGDVIPAIRALLIPQVRPRYTVNIERSVFVMGNEVTQKFLTIRSRDRRDVVTVIELLSPTNKDSKGGQTQYLAKRASYLRAMTNIVEIDLLRGGRRLPTKERLAGLDYHAFVTRHADRSHAAVYSWSLKDRLPVIPVPLDPGVPDVVVDLQAAFEQTYQRGGYDYTLNYDQEVAPELDEMERRWVRERLQQWT